MAPEPNPAYQEHKEKISEVAQRYHGFHVWVTRHGVPMATRRHGSVPPRGASAGWAATLMAERPGDWRDLETQLTEQLKIDEALADV